LNAARAFLEPIKKKYPYISYSDLWILASYVGLEHTGGPVIPFTSGRVDHTDESYWARNEMSYGRLPAAEKYLCPHLDDSNVGSSIDPATGTVKGWEGLCTHVRNEVFYRMGFNDREIVALLCGGHVYGRCHPNASGYAGKWVENPTQFSNEYAADMIEDEWTLVSHGDKWLIGMGAKELIPAVHIVAHWGVSHPDIAPLLLRAYPDGAVGRNRWERTPIEEALGMAGENGREHQMSLVWSLRRHPTYWIHNDIGTMLLPRNVRVAPWRMVDVADDGEMSQKNDDNVITSRAAVGGAVDVDDVGSSEEEDEGVEVRMKVAQSSAALNNNNTINDPSYIRKLAQSTDLSLLITKDKHWAAAALRCRSHPQEAREVMEVKVGGEEDSNATTTAGTTTVRRQRRLKDETMSYDVYVARDESGILFGPIIAETMKDKHEVIWKAIR
jgi:hypothetical protein